MTSGGESAGALSTPLVAGTRQQQEEPMAIAKTIEIIAASKSGIEDAVKSGLAKAGETIKGIEGAWIKDTKVTVEGGQVAEWRVTMVITFIVD